MDRDPQIAKGNAIPAALAEAIRAMSHDQLLSLILRLAQENPDFQRTLLTRVIIAPEIITNQPINPELVATFKKIIDDYFDEIHRRSEYEDNYHHRFDKDEPYPELDTLFEKVQTLNPTDQLEIYWYVVERGNNKFEEYSDGTRNMEKALAMYAETIIKFELEHQKKLPYLDLLLTACHWTMYNAKRMRSAIKCALDQIATSSKEQRYLVERLEKSQQPEAGEWLADYYLKLNDNQNYLHTRHQNLESEDQYLDLASYWKSQLNREKYLETMEQWVSTLPEKSRHFHLDYSYKYRPKPEGILTQLAEFYQQQNDDDNLCRILMIRAQYGDYTLELYRQIETVSRRINRWLEHQPILIDYARDKVEVLAKIYLYEEDWQSAIKLARTLAHNEQVKTMIAAGIKEHRPKDAVDIYRQIVQAHIDRKDRKHYQIAAQYAAEIKSIYLSIIKDSGAWQQYIDLLRKTYNRSPALKEEFSDL